MGRKRIYSDKERKNKQKMFMKVWRLKNRDKLLEIKKRYRIRNKEKIKLAYVNYTLRMGSKISDRNRLNKRGISKDKYEELVKIQNNLCAICNSSQIKGRSLAVDHCHKTGKIRGLLCGKCNVALGFVNDDINILNRMITYLLKL